MSRGGITIPLTTAAAALLANDSGEGPLIIQGIANATGGTFVIDGSNLVITASTAASVKTAGFDYLVSDNVGASGAHVTVDLVTTSSANNTVTVATLASEFSFIDGMAGIDTIVAAGGYTLVAGSGVENLQLKAGTTNVAILTGDNLANKLIGNDGDNTLRGLAGSDILQAGLGRDTLTGGDGSDTFIFNAGDSPSTASPLAYDTLNDFATGFDKIDLDIITGAGLVASAYAEVAIGANGFPAVLSAATDAMADGLHSVVFVAGSTDGWLLWNTDRDKHTAEQAVRLAGQNSLDDFARTDVI